MWCCLANLFAHSVSNVISSNKHFHCLFEIGFCNFNSIVAAQHLNTRVSFVIFHFCNYTTTVIFPCATMRNRTENHNTVFRVISQFAVRICLCFSVVQAKLKSIFFNSQTFCYTKGWSGNGSISLNGISLILESFASSRISCVENKSSSAVVGSVKSLFLPVGIGKHLLCKFGVRL